MALWLLLPFALIQIGIGFFAARRVKTEEDYLLAGRSLGTWLVSVSLCATWFGAELLTSTPGAAAASGLSGMMQDPIAYTLTLVFLGLFLAREMRARGYVTIGDFFRDRFGRGAETLAVVVMVPMSFLWASAQILALSHLAASISDVSFTTAVYVVIGTILVYNFAGGMRADVYTDAFQMALVVAGLGVMVFFVLHAAGSWGAALSAIRPEDLSFSPPDEKRSPLEWGELLAVPVLGAVIGQELFSRILAARDETTARRACFIAAAMYFGLGLVACFIAIAGRTLLPETPGAEDFMTFLASEVLPPWARVLFLFAFLSAILSTIDSNVLSISGLIGRGLIRLHEKKIPLGIVVLVERLLVVFSLIISAVLALSGGSVGDLVEASSAFGSAGVFVCVLSGLYTKRGDGTAALATLGTGVVFSALGIWLGWSAPFTTALVACVAVYFGLSALPQGVDRRDQTP